jgi:ABC-type transporter Mla maintaining outer membrane lipid asymmetry ATPase subunit MlaF
VDTDLMIEAQSLRKRFGDTVALDGLDLAVPRGAVLGVWGKETRFGWTVVLTIVAGVVQTARLADLFAVPAPLRLRSSARPRWR